MTLVLMCMHMHMHTHASMYIHTHAIYKYYNLILSGGQERNIKPFIIRNIALLPLVTVTKIHFLHAEKSPT